MKRLVILLVLAAACSRKTEAPVPPPAHPVTSSVQTSSAPATAVPGPDVPVPRSSTGALDACTLISTEDLQRITGSRFKAGINSTSQSDVMRCTFPREGGGGISIVLHLKDVMPEYRSMPGMTGVAGIADEALWSSQITTFVDRRREQVLVVGFNFAGGDQEKWGEEIVRRILPKL